MRKSFSGFALSKKGGGIGAGNGRLFASVSGAAEEEEDGLGLVSDKRLREGGLEEGPAEVDADVDLCFSFGASNGDSKIDEGVSAVLSIENPGI